MWPAAASTPGGNASRIQAHGPRWTQSSLSRCKRCLNSNVASTALHASIRSSGPPTSDGPPARCPAHALFTAQGQDPPRVQAVPQQRRQGRRSRAEPAAVGVQPSSPQPLLVRRDHLHPHHSWLAVPGDLNRPVQPPGGRLGHVRQHGGHIGVGGPQPQGLLEVIPTVVPSQVPSTPAASAAL